MKKQLKNIVVYMLVVLTTISLSTHISADFDNSDITDLPTQDRTKFPDTIFIDGVEKKVRTVNLEEYNNDTSGDFLILINNGEADGNNLLSREYNLDNSLVNRSGSRKFAIWLADKVVGYAIEKGLEYLVSSGVGQAVFAKVGAAALAAWPVVAAVAVGVAVVVVVAVGVNYVVNRTTNSAGCVWSGPRVGGHWLCPMRLDLQ